ncbi:MAG: hypothetical protein WKG03_03700 [Telluria sp.]
MAKVRYIGRDGKKLDQDDYKIKRDDPVYNIVRQFDNGQVRVVLKWIGRMVNPHQTYPDLYKVFAMSVWNYTSSGGLAPDPADDDKGFPTEASAIAAYEAFLAKWTASKKNSSGVFEEVDNVLDMPVPPPPPAPPPPPPPPVEPDKPQTPSDVPELGGVGAW